MAKKSATPGFTFSVLKSEVGQTHIEFNFPGKAVGTIVLAKGFKLPDFGKNLPIFGALMAAEMGQPPIAKTLTGKTRKTTSTKPKV